LLEQIGAYAGLAAIPGLAVLSALYFSQARDVRRLREWAGRAPERAAEQAAGGRVVAQPQQAAKPAAATPGAKPAVAKPATAGAAKPAHAGKAAVTPAGIAAAAAKAAQSGHGAAAPATASAAGVAAKEADVEPSVGAAAARTPAAAAATGAGAARTTAGGGGSATGTVTRPAVGGARPGGHKTNGPGAGGRPAGAGAPAVRRPIPQLTGAQKTSVLGPTGPRQRWYRRAAARLPAARYIALIVVGALVLGGGAAFGISQLTSKDSGSSGQPSGGNPAAKSPSGGSTKRKHAPATPAIPPSSVTVTVVNGTNIANLARDTAAKLGKFGFQIGNTVTGTGPLAAAESVVEYKPGARDKAVFVARKLNINQTQPADADALAQAGPADTIVVLGADQAPGG
jgi:hypothetical protein